MPVFGTSAATFNDDGVTALYQHLRDLLAEHGLPVADGRARRASTSGTPRASRRSCRPTGCATWPRSPRPCAATTPRPSELADGGPPRAAPRAGRAASWSTASRPTRRRRACWTRRAGRPARRRRRAARATGPAVVESYSGDEQVVTVRDREIRTPLTRESLSGNKVPRVALPRFTDHGELVRFWRRENLPGCFPFTAGVFPFKRDGEDPARMFAGEGDPFRTNRRFQLLSARRPGDPAVDRVRLGHPLRPRPRPAPRHLRQGRHLGRLGRDARRHEGALRRLRPVSTRPRRCR